MHLYIYVDILCTCLDNIYIFTNIVNIHIYTIIHMVFICMSVYTIRTCFPSDLHDTYRVGTQKKVSLRLQEVPLPKRFQILTRTSPVHICSGSRSVHVVY